MMNKASHILLGKLLCQRLEDDYDMTLDRGSFLFGSILPDINPIFMIKPHFIGSYGASVLRRVHRLLHYKLTSAMIDRRFSRQLGIICHYYADFFTRPHVSGYNGTLGDHIAYEYRLQSCLSAGDFDLSNCLMSYSPADDVSSTLIMDQLQKRQSLYLNLNAAQEQDIIHAFNACLEAIVLITCTALAASQESSAQESALSAAIV